MSTFIMFGKYSQDSIKGISAERSDKAINLVREVGGDIRAGYALLGETDLVLITDFSLFLSDSSITDDISCGLTDGESSSLVAENRPLCLSYATFFSKPLNSPSNIA